MTRTISTKTPNRYACERCSCEIGGGSDPTTTVVLDSAFGWGHRKLAKDEDPVAFDPACSCNCHDNWKLNWGLAGPIAKPERRKRSKKVTKKAPVPAEPVEDDEPW